MKYAKRSGTCVATEKTDMLVFDAEFCQNLFQSAMTTQNPSVTGSIKKQDEKYCKNNFSSAGS